MGKRYDEAACMEEAEKVITDDSKKTVFWVGDSIRMGACNYTKEYLSDVANLVFPEENCRFTQYTFVNLAQWRNLIADPEKVDVVFWNNGHWDIAHWGDSGESLNDIETYCKMLERLYNRFREWFPNAKVVFYTTTPMNPANVPWVNWRTNDEIIKYNNAATEALKSKDILIFDAFSLLKDKPAHFYSDYCHFTDEGFQEFGRLVADYLKTLL